ncbi:sulfurtransferase TusA family protein [Virgibacillus sp. Bac330]|uniref:sulfurtransferase TusA family protein n=1 Tax=Virgibacillus sp. Bac330 TaxID=2419841 RepID=UPI000EF47E7B|nr:sulfurtransferase TusA family protein [Virgibacillus sp. Bac330]
MSITANEVLDAKGLSCPMPIVKTKQAISNLKAGEVIEVQATDKGSTADIKAWSESTGHQYIGTVEEGDVLKHYIRVASEAEKKEEAKHDNVVDLNDIQKKVEAKDAISILDVREPAEFAFGHIPGAINIPLDQLDVRLEELDKERELYVICRTGSRSDLAAQKLTSQGFNNVINVVPGMTKWEGPLEKNN